MSWFDQSVFKSYDVRGTYPDQVDERFARALGRALPLALGGTRVLIGHDARLSSPFLYGALAAGLHEGGAEVAGMGLCATELVYYVTGGGERFDLGVMITASHNPPRYNGFKVLRRGGEPVSAASGLDAVQEAMARTAPPSAGSAAPPPKSVAAESDYLDFALGLLGAPDVGGLRIAVDPGSGVGGLLWERLARRLGCELVRLNFEPDGAFPAHHPDPSRRENLDQIVAAVQREGAALGLAYDGDADRVVAVLPDGHVVDGSEVTVCVAERLRERTPELTFAVGHTASRKALDHFRAEGIEPLMVPVGHAKVKAAMRATPEMAFAGEDAGHYYYRDFFCCDSALLTTLHLLHLAAAERVGAIVNGLPGPWVRPLREPAFRFADKGRALEVCRQVALRVLGRNPDPLEMTCEVAGRIKRRCSMRDIGHCEGVRVDYPDWWLCVRPSGTEPVARLALEARDAGLLERQTEALRSLFDHLS